MEFYEFESMLHAANNATDALLAFDGLWFGFLVGGLGILALLLPTAKQLNVNRRALIFSTSLICVFLISILYIRNGDGTKAMPAQYTSMAYAGLMLKDNLLNPVPDVIPKVSIPHALPAFNGDLIVVMDESIRGDFLDINNKNGVKTSLDTTHPNLINFGIASSATNCSDTSNLSLRRGVSRAEYLHEKDHNPGLWRYAKKAGYRTVYLDAQLTDGRLGNHMTKNEKSHIDWFYQISDGPHSVMHKDNILAEQLNKLLNNGTRDFIYINKMGAHFPYEGKYPIEASIYKPVMEGNQFNKSYPEEGELPHPNDHSKLMRLRFINSYKNALSWNITHFFKTFSPGNESQPYTLIYTSDHGQSFHDDGREGYGTHCSVSKTDPEEGIVPFLMMSNDESVLNKLARAQHINKNKVSHFNIAPTVYELMGYDVSQLAHNERTIFQPLDSADQQFLSKYFVRFGSQPIWNSIEMNGRDSLHTWN